MTLFMSLFLLLSKFNLNHTFLFCWKCLVIFLLTPYISGCVFILTEFFLTPGLHFLKHECCLLCFLILWGHPLTFLKFSTCPSVFIPTHVNLGTKLNCYSIQTERSSSFVFVFLLFILIFFLFGVLFVSPFYANFRGFCFVLKLFILCWSITLLCSFRYTTKWFRYAYALQAVSPALEADSLPSEL